MLEKGKDKLTIDGSAYEGREKAFMDIDRMINEGMSGGTVHSRHNSTNIEEAIEHYEEQPPYECE